MENEENIEINDEQQTDQYSGQPIDPDFIPQDPVQLDRDWYTPANEKRNKGLVTKNLVLSNLAIGKDTRKIDLTIELINILDGIILNYTQTTKNPEKIKPLLQARNNITIEHDAMLASRRAYHGDAQKLSRTSRYHMKQEQTTTNPAPTKKNKLLP